MACVSFALPMLAMGLTAWSSQILIIISGIAALAYGIYIARAIGQKSPGTEQMQKISNAVQRGAMAFLTTEYKVLSVYVSILALLIFYFLDNKNPGHGMAISFVCGALFSALAGWIGMKVATTAAVRTTEAAKTSLGRALSVAFSSGTVMGMVVVGLGLLGVYGIFVALYVAAHENLMTAYSMNDADAWQAAGEWATSRIFAFGLGASSIALFARVAGGIFTKAADVGADLVGKVEAGIPEDDPRNPAVIADNVGDNVGDVAGMGADLFESYVGSIIACMSLGVYAAFDANYNTPVIGAPILLPILVSAIGILASLVGVVISLMSISDDEKKITHSIDIGLFSAGIIMIALTYFVCNWMSVVISDCPYADAHGGGAVWGVWMAILVGQLCGIAIGKITEYYTGDNYAPVQFIAKQTETGEATVIIGGLAVGMMSCLLPVLCICGAIWVSYYYSGLYGIAMAGVGMLGTLGISLGVDAYGPVADNAGGIAEMAHCSPDVRKRTDSLDAVGNTTAAMGKGFAIGSAALTALALFQAYAQSSGLYPDMAVKAGSETIMAKSSTPILNMFEPNVLIGLFIGGVLPFVFSAMALKAVGKAAYSMIEEVRRQFREIPGLLKGEAEPDYERCVAISTKAAIVQIIVPTILAIAMPLLVGKLLGKDAVGGLLAGATITGVMMAIFMANAGGAWDNTKKFIEKGNLGGKGGKNHKAAVIGDTVGDPFKDTAGPSLNILLKLMCIVSLVFVGIM